MYNYSVRKLCICNNRSVCKVFISSNRSSCKVAIFSHAVPLAKYACTATVPYTKYACIASVPLAKYACIATVPCAKYPCIATVRWFYLFLDFCLIFCCLHVWYKMPVVAKTNELSVLVSVYNKFSLFNHHSMRLFFHVYINANELCLKKKVFKIQDYLIMS